MASGNRRRGLGEELGSGHLRHALIGQEEGNLVVAAGQLTHHLEGGRSTVGNRHPIIGPVMLVEVAPDGGHDLGVVVDGDDGWLGHGARLRARCVAHVATLPERASTDSWQRFPGALAHAVG